jgi:eIF-2B alpha/beta/delta-like uncharacterized protein
MADVAIRDLIGKLAEDRTSGAAELAGKGAAVVMALAGRIEAVDTASFVQGLADAGRLLIRSQPSMAPLFNLVNGVLGELEGVVDLEEARRRTRDAARGFREELVSRGEQIAHQALGVILPGSTLLTHSRSSTVLRALLHARSEGGDFEVVCTESRPLYEGRAVAEELSKRHIPTTVIIDAGVAEVMERVDLVVVGADAVSPDGLVNKVGTYLLALAASAHGVPFYSLCGTEKFLPANYPFFAIEDRNPEEVWPDHPRGVSVVNRYFDVTPLEYVSGLVTERGVLGQGELEQMLGQLKMHKLLLETGQTGREERG